MIDYFEITESTTREELIVRVSDLDEEIQILETKVEDQKQEINDQKQEINDLVLAPEQLERLTEAADEEAARGRIHNTPYAKRQWIEGN